MSKFKCTENSMDFVEVIRDKEGRPALTVGDNHSVSVAFLARSDAPALALAILEAAGWPNEHLATTEILRRLRELDEHAKAVEAEARERAELEAEALELLNAWLNMQDYDTYASWAEVEEFRAKMWLAVARRAREMRTEK